MIRNNNINDIFFKNLTASVLEIFNNNISYYIYRHEDRPPEVYQVPFFYTFSSDSNFMKEFFYMLPDDCDVTAEGNYDRFPRGNMKLDDFEIKTDDMTNKFVRGSYNKEDYEQGHQQPILAPYSAYLFSIPMDVTYNFEIRSEHYNQMFKVIEDIITTLYKNRVVYFNYNGLKLQSQLQLAENFNTDKKFNFIYEDDQIIKLDFNVKVEAYLPSFTEETEMYGGNIIKQFDYYVDQLKAKHNQTSGPVETSYDQYINNLEFEAESLREVASLDYQIGSNDSDTIANTLNEVLNPNERDQLKNLLNNG